MPFRGAPSTSLGASPGDEESVVSSTFAKKQIPRGVYPAPGGARNDNQKHFFSKLLSLLAGWLTAGCCSGVKHCSPGLRKVVAQGSHNDVINSYGFATGARPGPPVDVGIRQDRKSTRLNSSHGYISYAVFCL